jgi:hypothetical protein
MLYILKSLRKQVAGAGMRLLETTRFFSMSKTLKTTKPSNDSKTYSCLYPCTKKFPNEVRLQQHYQCLPKCRDNWNVYFQKQVQDSMAGSDTGVHTLQDTSDPVSFEFQIPWAKRTDSTERDMDLSEHNAAFEPDATFEPEGVFAITQEIPSVDIDDQESDSELNSVHGSAILFESEEPFDGGYKLVDPDVNDNERNPHMDKEDWGNEFPCAGEIKGQSESYFARIV